MRVGITAVAACLQILLCAGCASRPGKPEHRPVEEFYSKADLDVLRSASRLRVVRVNAEAPETNVSDPSSDRILGYLTIGHAREVAPDLAERFRAALLDPTTYDLPPPGSGFLKLCGRFQPGVALRFEDKLSRRVDILLCFTCDDLGIKMPVWIDQATEPTDTLVTADMADGSQRLLGLVVEALPEASEFRELWTARDRRSQRPPI
jgi:hypothetical protein